MAGTRDPRVRRSSRPQLPRHSRRATTPYPTNGIRFEPLHSLIFGWGGRGGDEGLARTRGGYVADQGARAAKMKSAPGPGTTDLGYSTTPHPTKGVRPRARSTPCAFRDALGQETVSQRSFPHCRYACNSAADLVKYTMFSFGVLCP